MSIKSAFSTAFLDSRKANHPRPSERPSVPHPEALRNLADQVAKIEPVGNVEHRRLANELRRIAAALDRLSDDYALAEKEVQELIDGIIAKARGGE